MALTTKRHPVTFIPCSNNKRRQSSFLLDIASQAFNIAACFAANMATSGAGQLGVTAPLSVALPTEAELQASAALVDELKRQNNYESPAETNKRYVSQSVMLDES
jgi:SLT domain-containing protein